eukprot:CAMPEP_0168617772 /NCGR_PEP_ID=MMETSP0449_2-20121227/5719_1 /TAXON_ID=1082188 /ORGANISM="Strombidium rassoulzadegani, Strain ras09" /LENGTH=85 /DNA_ID=CAMNT_0008658607 /DNA_START=110 /DNA_END=367 /DNA_ORIENTATION=-
MGSRGEKLELAVQVVAYYLSSCLIKVGHSSGLKQAIFPGYMAEQLIDCVEVLIEVVQLQKLFSVNFSNYGLYGSYWIKELLDFDR